MGEYHDAAATYYGDEILKRIREEDEKFKQIFSKSMVRVGEWDWPRPDYICYDEENKVTYALEFKPPNQSKREYLTGLGQTLAYLQTHTYSGLIVPKYADDGFPIADFITNTLSAVEFQNVGSSIYAYDPLSQDIQLLRSISNKRTSLSEKKVEVKKTFWCWWRDLSHYEVYDLLNLSFIYGDLNGDIYTNNIFPHFYKRMLDKKTKQWDGTPRVKKDSESSRKAEKQNSKIPLVQLGLWSSSEGRLTDEGFKVLEIGKKYGPNSARFFDYLAYLLLIEGRHLDLINMVDRFQKDVSIAEKSKEHAKALEMYLDEKGCIGKRKPGEVTTDAKGSYMRDEMKLWNKFGFLEKNGNNYFFPKEGYKFNWKRITDVLISNQ